MKFTALLFCFLSFSSLDCGKGDIGKNSTGNANNSIVSQNGASKNTNMENGVSDGNLSGDIEYSINIRTVKKGMHDGVNYSEDTFYIDYEVKNSSAANYLLFNRGHTNKADKNAVYAEAASNGVVEFSQKAFAQPGDKQCPATDALVLPRATLLRAGETIKNQVKVAFSSKSNTPFDFCSPSAAPIAKAESVKFCLGVMKASGDVKVDSNGNVSNLKSLGEQKFLCSETKKL